MKTKTGTCDCHKYALNDATFRTVYWCKLCKAWICEECQDQYWRRMRAWFNRSISGDAISKK
jgi:hypothetical protein